jgi:hypothetical protein
MNRGGRFSGLMDRRVGGQSREGGGREGLSSEEGEGEDSGKVYY